MTKQLILYLHLALLVEQVAFLPFVYTSSNTLCSAMGFFHAYAALSNLVAMWLVTIYGINYIHTEYVQVDQFIYRWKEFLIFVFPIITVFPFIQDDYGEQGGAWCELLTVTKGQSKSAALGIVFYYFWVWFFIIFSLGITAYIVIESLRQGAAIARAVMTSIGGYGTIALIGWLPYSVRKLLHRNTSDQQALGLTLPIYVTGILYALLYIYCPNIVTLPDKAHVRETTVEFKMSDLEAIAMNPMPSMSVNGSWGGGTGNGTGGAGNGRVGSADGPNRERLQSVEQDRQFAAGWGKTPPR